MKRIVCAALVLFTLAGSAWAGFDEGVAAYRRGDYVTALREWLALAEQGDSESQYNLGLMYTKGLGVARNYAEARRWYRKAAEQAYAMAQFNLGVMYDEGLGVTRDYSKAARWYREAAGQGVAMAQFSLGSMYDTGQGVARNHTEAARWYRKAAEQGDATSQISIGTMYANGRGVAKDPAEAANWYRKAAEQGNAPAQFVLAAAYLNGDGVAQDHTEAERWYREAAEQGVAEAQVFLGRMYDTGGVVPRDHAEAARWYRKAAEQGGAEAQFSIGFMYYFGRGVRQDYREAEWWYRKAAEQDHADAQFGLGTMYFHAKGVRQDDDEAMRWYRRAAEQDYPDGQNSVGQMYRDGRGVERDQVEAHKWFSLAISRMPVGKYRDKAIKARDDVAAGLTRTQRSEAERRARDWRPGTRMASKSRDSGSGTKTRRVTAPSPPIVAPVKPAVITGIQRGLAELGFDPGSADGALGPRTRAAIVAFQKDKGLTVTGEVSEALAQALRAENSARATIRNRYGVAVIIGNKTYKGRTPAVEFAHNDANAMKRFVIGRLGYRPGNIIDLRDATRAEIAAVFGNEDTHKGRLFNYARAGRSDVVVFYSGHGVPGLDDRRGYLLPVDGDPNLARITGYPVDLLYANLAKIEAKSVTVYLDACFSGDSPKGLLVRAASGLSVTPREPVAAPGLVVVTAASGDQLASWDEDAKHGLFTLHLLKALRGAADSDEYGKGDGKVTLGEVKKYLDDEMSYQARRRYGRAQTASVQGAPSLVLTTRAPGRRPGDNTNGANGR